MDSACKYRPEIDGLRAVAILCVLFFHAGIKCPGGFIGVDVFFVISGYLISSIVLRDIESGTFSFATFWERRFRRIVPALTFLVLVTLVAGSVLLLPKAYSDLGKSTVWQSLFAANFYFHQDIGYFAAQAEEKPLLHTWSLAVEEQFYFFVPIALLCILKLKVLRQYKLLGITFLVIALCSFSWCATIVEQAPHSAFFLLPSRAWELVIGLLIALIPGNLLPKKSWWREVTALIGLIGILIPVFYYGRTTLFPGYAALPPVMGAALVIISNLRTELNPPTLCGRILAWPPLVGIGLISYSLYLWHWPLFAFANYWSFSPITKYNKVILVAVSFLFAFLSWRHIELPFRRKNLCPTQRGMFILTGVSLVLTLGLAFLICSFDNHPIATPVLFGLNSSDAISGELMSNKQVSEAEIVSNDLIPLGKSGPDDDVVALLWGDSHAMAAFPAFDNALKSYGVCGRAIVHSGTAPLIDFRAKVPNGTSIDTVAYSEAALKWIAKSKVKHIFLVGYWHVYERKGAFDDSNIDVSKISFSEYYKVKIFETVKKLTSLGCIPWIMLQVPEHSFDVPKAYAHCRYFGGHEQEFETKIGAWNGLAGNESAFLISLINEGAKIIDARSIFADPSKCFYTFGNESSVFYGDKHHLSIQGAQDVLGPKIKSDLSSSGLFQ